MQKEDLMRWSGLEGFITQWHLYGYFDSGLEKNSAPNLFDLKQSKFWQKEHLLAIGGATGCFDVQTILSTVLDVHWKWDLAQPLYTPELRLSELREYYPEWEERLKGIDTNSWSNLYYALAVLESPAEMDACLHFCGWDGCRLWVNGEFVFEEHSFHKSIYEKEKVYFSLKKGQNQILFQLDRDGLVARLEVLSEKYGVQQVQAIILNKKPLKRKISTFFQLHEMVAGKQISHRYPSKLFSDFDRWKHEMLNYYHSCLGEGPETNSQYGEYRLIETIDKGKYIQEEYRIQAEMETEFPSILLKPKPEINNGIALVLLHGHVGNFRTLLGEAYPIGPRMWVGEYRGDYAKRMAEKGFTVATYCARAFSERKDLFQNTDACNKAQMMCAAMSLQLPRLHIADIHLVYQLLIKQKGVNRDKVGVSGLSGGGSLSYISGAFDDKFKAVAAFCCICSYRDYANGEGCGMQVVNGWFPKADMGDLLGLICPRPLLIGQGTLDTTFNSVQAKEAYKIAKEYYLAKQKGGLVELELYPLAHEYEQDLAEIFFKKHLS